MAQAGARLGLSRARMYQLVVEGRLKATKVGAAWIIEERHLDRFAALVRRPGRPRKDAPK